MLTSDPGAKEKPSKITDIPGQSVASPYRCLVYYVTSGDDSCRDRIWLVSCGSNIPKVRKMLAKKTWFCFAILSSSAYAVFLSGGEDKTEIYIFTEVNAEYSRLYSVQFIL